MLKFSFAFFQKGTSSFLKIIAFEALCKLADFGLETILVVGKITVHATNNGGNGQWAFRTRPGTRTQLKTSVLVDDSLKLPVETDRRGPDQATGMEIRVRPGSTLTVLANGAFRTRQGVVTPDGLSEGKRSPLKPVTGLVPLPAKLGEMFPIKPSLLCAESNKDTARSARHCIRPGALVGSFDKFRSSFVIGPAATLTVPNQAELLMIRLAPENRNPLRVDGEGFTVQVIGQATDQLVAIPEVDPRLFAKSGLALLPLGANLPAWVVRAEVDTGRFVTINGKTYSSRLPLGSFGSFITRVRQ